MLQTLISKLFKPTNKVVETQPQVSNPKTEYPEHLKYGSSVVGYTDAYSQDYTYINVLKTIPKNDSILDFGCGRGDLYGHLLRDERNVVNYLGVETNNLLADIGQSQYPAMDIRRDSWFNLRFDDIRDWSVAIATFDVLYSAEQTANPYDYLVRTIDTMLQQSRKGAVITFLKPDPATADGILTYDFSIIYFAIREYNFILDASSIPGTYKLIILKPYEY